MDELLHNRVKQLKEIEDILERMEKKSILYSVTADLRSLRADLFMMIQQAEQEHDDF